MSRIAGWFALLWTAGVAAVLLFAPGYATGESAIMVVVEGGPARGFGVGTAELLAEGGAVYPFVLPPIAVALLPLLLRTAGARRAASAVGAALLGGHALFAFTSIGAAYLPAVVVLTIAAAGRKALAPAAPDRG